MERNECVPTLPVPHWITRYVITFAFPFHLVPDARTQRGIAGLVSAPGRSIDAPPEGVLNILFHRTLEVSSHTTREELWVSSMARLRLSLVRLVARAARILSPRYGRAPK